ncbi:MAG: serine/threonine-protein kinase [Polyangiales bacterium]
MPLTVRLRAIDVLPPGETIDDRYRVVRRLGEGGMGVVYEAEHQILRRRVAIKLLHPRYASIPEAVRRFVREARAAAAVGHPAIVDVLDFGSYKGNAYLVMELLKGETLADRLDRDRSLSVEEACHVTAQVLSAISAAHAAGIVHRDLKPENVFLLRPESGRPRVKVLDFGISKVQALEGDDCRTTGAGNPLGTPGYMAPEQWMCEPDVDHRADLYALGVMLYEMLTSELPFDAEIRGEQFIKVVVSHEPPRPLSAYLSDAPEELDAVILRALERKRGQRYQRAGEFYAALGPFGVGDVAFEDLAPNSRLPELSDEASIPPRAAEVRIDSAALKTEPPSLPPEPARPPASAPPPPPQAARARNRPTSDPEHVGVVVPARDSQAEPSPQRRRSGAVAAAAALALLAGVR